ncbi:hypothetical protein [Alicyclobacillus ferrooxydans]|uniref:Uncharacterized protein n=1 Tax=Alicyclobacillus ferrooxydans TaxID=471514 RepID=A0A0P9CIL8_9BACL|nr:hypothetical protein [Alicyclobacillus ferrooxydans]KPV45496.1 hypothetical protein AN477_00600 [Alicyclobacillus ferrooxydans]
MAMTVQQYVQGLLDEHGVKANAVAAKAEMSASYFYRVLGSDENISPKFLRKIAPHVPGASVHRMMVLAGYLPDDEGGENESLEDLRVRVYDLKDKLEAALEKYVGLLGVSEEPDFLEATAPKKALELLLRSVETGKAFRQFGFVEREASKELVRAIAWLKEGQGKLFKPLVEELTGVKESDEQMKTPPTA